MEAISFMKLLNILFFNFKYINNLGFSKTNPARNMGGYKYAPMSIVFSL